MVQRPQVHERNQESNGHEWSGVGTDEDTGANQGGNRS